jgi:hypothetical protein
VLNIKHNLGCKVSDVSCLGILLRLCALQLPGGGHNLTYRWEHGAIQGEAACDSDKMGLDWTTPAKTVGGGGALDQFSGFSAERWI